MGGISRSFVLRSWRAPRSTLFPYTTLFRSRDGLLWIGSVGDGLRLIDGSKTFHFTMRDGLFDDDIYGIVADDQDRLDRKSTRLNSSHPSLSYAVFCLKKKRPLGPPGQARER